MQLSRNFLAEFVDLSGVTDTQLAELLTVRIAEVEHIVQMGCAIAGVVTGRVLAIALVEGADKIRLATVDLGTEQLSIVCGAVNLHEGAIVPVATIGTVLPGDFRIEKRKLKGVESFGMICAKSELGLPSEEQGIWLLPPETPVGVPLSQVVPADTVFEIDNHAITHRPDLFGQIGFAREVATALGRSFTPPTEQAVTTYDGGVAAEVTVPELCTRYLAVQISGVAVTESPAYIRERLEACGIRPIDNIVDATNYILLEQGQPLHAFDAAAVQGALAVRAATAGETLALLDGSTLELADSMLVIADEARPLALAGIMGGQGSGVSVSTTAITLEAATFDPVTIRRTSQATGIRTESSLRFEKRLSPELPPVAVERFLTILRLTCPEIAVTAATDISNFTPTPRELVLPLAAVTAVLGAAVPSAEITRILTTLGFGVTPRSDSELIVAVPYFRAGRDIATTIDLVEEVARHYGYDRLPLEFPALPLAAPSRTPLRALTRELADLLVGFGFHETCTLSLRDESVLRRAGCDPTAQPTLVNPPSADFRYLRPALLPGLLAVAESNLRHSTEFRLFELSSVFAPNPDATLPPLERQQGLALIVGEADPFAALRGTLQQLMQSLRLPLVVTPTATAPATAHPGQAAQLTLAGKHVGHLAALHPAIAAEFGLPAAAYLQLDLAALAEYQRGTVQAADLPRYPGVPRDLAVVVPEHTLASTVAAAIAGTDPRITELTLFDTYTGSGIPTGHKSLAYRFVIQDTSKTLADSEVTEIMQAVTAVLTALGGQLRD